MKTNTSTLISRYIWLLNNISEAGERGLSREEINRRWQSCIYNEDHEDEIPRKTFYNYKCEIESLFEITLEAVRIDGHFRYRIAQEESLQRSQVKQMLLNSLSINEAYRSGGELAEKILMEDIPSSGGAALSTIMQAIRSSHVLRIEHKSFKPGSRANVSEVYPYCVKLREQRWYLLAYKPEEQEPRVYGLDRIGECTILDDSFDQDALKKFFADKYGVTVPEDYFRDYYGVYVDDTVPLMDITVRVYTSQYVNYFRSLPLHISQSEIRSSATEEGEQYSDFAYHIHPTIDFTRKLLSYGSFVEVLSPKEYAAQVGEMVIKSAVRYK